MTKQHKFSQPFSDFVIRSLRIGASTIAIVEMIRSDWLSGGLAAVAWLFFVQVERRRRSLIDKRDN